jgi:hypothetical protein
MPTAPKQRKIAIVGSRSVGMQLKKSIMLNRTRRALQIIRTWLYLLSSR